MKRKTEVLSDALGDIDDELLYQAQQMRAKKPSGRKTPFVRWAAVAAVGIAVGFLVAKLPPIGGMLQGTVVDVSDVNGWLFIDDGAPLIGVQENLPGWEDYRFTFGDDGVLQTVEQRTDSGWQPIWQAGEAD